MELYFLLYVCSLEAEIKDKKCQLTRIDKQIQEEQEEMVKDMYVVPLLVVDLMIKHSLFKKHVRICGTISERKSLCIVYFHIIHERSVVYDCKMIFKLVLSLFI